MENSFTFLVESTEKNKLYSTTSALFSHLKRKLKSVDNTENFHPTKCIILAAGQPWNRYYLSCSHDRLIWVWVVNCSYCCCRSSGSYHTVSNKRISRILPINNSFCDQLSLLSVFFLVITTICSIPYAYWTNTTYHALRSPVFIP